MAGGLVGGDVTLVALLVVLGALLPLRLVHELAPLDA